MRVELEGASAIGSVGADSPDNYQTVLLLTQLPRELRNEIYKHVFFPAARGTSNEERESFDGIPRSQYQILPFHVHDSHDGWRLLHVPRLNLGIIRICRQIHDEAEEILYIAAW